jgi:hypothetical protein
MKPASNRRWIKRFSGLKLYSIASEDGMARSTIPFGTMIEINADQKKSGDMDGMNGTWYLINWDDREGWVFDGYLSYYRLPDRPQQELVQEIPSEWHALVDQGGTLYILEEYKEESPEVGLGEMITIRQTEGSGPSIDHMSIDGFLEYIITSVETSGNMVTMVCLPGSDMAADPVTIEYKPGESEGLSYWRLPGSTVFTQWCTSETKEQYSKTRIMVK